MRMMPFSPTKMDPRQPRFCPYFFSSSSTTGGRCWNSRFRQTPILLTCSLSYGMPGFTPSCQCSVTASMPSRAGNFQSISVDQVQLPAQPHSARFASTLSGTTLPRSSAQKTGSMMCVPMLPIEPLP